MTGPGREHSAVAPSTNTHPLPSPTTAAAANPRFPVRTTLIADWRDAEKVAAAWMVALGFSTAKATPGGADAGVDVRAPKIAIAQVMRMPSVIGRREIQLLVGSRHPQLQEKTLFFFRSGYHWTAMQWADLWEVALFRFDDFGNPFPENKAARDLCRANNYSDWRTMTPPSDRWVSRETAHLHRSQILSTTGTPVRSKPSATRAIKAWAAACGYSDAMTRDGEPELVTANGLISSLDSMAYRSTLSRSAKLPSIRVNESESRSPGWASPRARNGHPRPNQSP